MLKKRDGFAGESLIVIPRNVLKSVKENPLIHELYITDIGYYPTAKYHFCKRRRGLDQYILIYIVDGKGYIQVDGKTHTLQQNQFFIIPPFMPHAYEADAEHPWTIYWVHFKGEKSQFFNNMSNQILEINETSIERLKGRINLFIEILEALSLGYSLENLEYANMCFWHLMASFKYINQFHNINQIAKFDLVKKAIVFMKNNVEKRLTLRDIATECDLSPSHFSKLFIQRTRHTPIVYFIYLKMQYACQLLDFTTHRISEIGREIGYDDPYYFSRIFKKIMHVSPREYRLRGEKFLSSANKPTQGQSHTPAQL